MVQKKRAELLIKCVVDKAVCPESGPEDIHVLDVFLFQHNGLK